MAVKKLKAALISLGSVSSKWITQEMKNYFDSVDSLQIKEFEVKLDSRGPVVLYKGEPLKDYDCVFLRGSFHYSPLLSSIRTALHGKTYMPFSQGVFVSGHDKLLTHLKMVRAKIPMPVTYIASSPQSAKKILEKVNYPIVMKFPQGTQGKGVLFADSFSSASSMLDALTALKQPFIIQEFVDSGGKDVRVIVAGDEVLAAMQRTAKDGEDRSNLHAGGEGEKVEVDFLTKKVAVDTAKALGAEICGVDILKGTKGMCVIEINLSPGLQGITKCTEINVANKIAEYLYNQTLEFKRGGSKEVLTEMGIEEAMQNKEIVMNLDVRGTRILLPEILTDLTKISETDEVSIKAKAGELVIKKTGKKE